MLRGSRLGLRGSLARPGGPGVPGVGAEAAGRWSLLPPRELDPTVRAHALAAQLLDRHGIVTRAVAPAEGVAGQFGAIYRVLAALEQAGQVRRGYFIEHLGGSQFALPGAVDQVRADAKEAAAEDDPDRGTQPDSGTQPDRGARPDRDTRPDRAGTVLLAATDPANPYGAALAWPAPLANSIDGNGSAGNGSTGNGLAGNGSAGNGSAGNGSAGAIPGAGDPARHRPGRKAGAVVVLVAGALVLYVERGGRTLLSFSADAGALAAAAGLLAETVRGGRLGRLTVQRGDGAVLLGGQSLLSPLGRALTDAGFAPTPRGLRLRGQA